MGVGGEKKKINEGKKNIEIIAKLYHIKLSLLTKIFIFALLHLNPALLPAFYTSHMRSYNTLINSKPKVGPKCTLLENQVLPQGRSAGQCPAQRDSRACRDPCAPVPSLGQPFLTVPMQGSRGM